MSKLPPSPQGPRHPSSTIKTGAAPTTPLRTSPTPRAAAPHVEPVKLSDPSQRNPLLMLLGLLIVLILAYADMFGLISAAWNEELYSHGWIVPLFALGLLWLRWQPFGPVPMRERWIGLGLLAFGLVARLFAAEYTINPVDRLSFIPSIFGVFMLVGGMQVVRWAWPALAFLVFMFPLPSALEVSVLNRLQRVATISSTFVLQTLGVSAFRTGNLISIPGMDQPMNVAEGCAGLRMATIFAALAVAMVFIIERPWWDKFVILMSAIPIAIFVNIVRITVTGLLFMVVGQENHAVHKIMHDWAGLLIMMPLAMALLWLELQILERLTIPVDSVQLRPVGGPRGMAPMPGR
jgi:exosortase